MQALILGLIIPLVLAWGGVFPPPPPPPATSLPVAPLTATAVPGIPEPCLSTRPWPTKATPGQTRTAMQTAFGLRLTGPGWTTPGYRPVVKVIWQTLDAIACTDYLAQTKTKTKSKIHLNATSTWSWAWGDWGLTKSNAVTLDFAKLMTAHRSGDDGRIVRLLIHELGHAYNVDRAKAPAYWTSFQKLYRQQGRFSDYGNDSMEAMAEVIGYYVARCAKDNPYDTGEHAAYYRWARTAIFHDVEFGPAPGVRPRC